MIYAFVDQDGDAANPKRGAFGEIHRRHLIIIIVVVFILVCGQL